MQYCITTHNNYTAHIKPFTTLRQSTQPLREKVCRAHSALHAADAGVCDNRDFADNLVVERIYFCNFVQQNSKTIFRNA